MYSANINLLSELSKEEMTMDIKRFMTTVVSALTLVFFTIDPASADEELKFAGCSTSTVSYMNAAAKAYEAKTGIRVGVRGGGATLGIKSAIAGSVDMGGTCRHKMGDEVKADVNLTRVGFDALVFVVHPSNPIQNVTTDQMIDIFEGKITSWKALGGPDKPIIIVERKSPNSGVRLSFKEMLGGYEIKLTGSALTFEDTDEVEAEVEKNPFSFAVSGSGSAVQQKIKVISFNGIAPTKENFTNGTYPFVRPLYLTVKKDISPKMKKFVDFLLSDDGQAIIGKHAINLKEYQHAAMLYDQESGVLTPRVEVRRRS